MQMRTLGTIEGKGAWPISEQCFSPKPYHSVYFSCPSPDISSQHKIYHAILEKGINANSK